MSRPWVAGHGAAHIVLPSLSFMAAAGIPSGNTPTVVRTFPCKSMTPSATVPSGDILGMARRFPSLSTRWKACAVTTTGRWWCPAARIARETVSLPHGNWRRCNWQRTVYVWAIPITSGSQFRIPPPLPLRTSFKRWETRRVLSLQTLGVQELHRQPLSSGPGRVGASGCQSADGHLVQYLVVRTRR